jgi:hypothetical protein
MAELKEPKVAPVKWQVMRHVAPLCSRVEAMNGNQTHFAFDCRSIS